MYDHYVPALIDNLLVALRVPDAVHAVPARDLAGRAAGDVRVPDGDLGADRPAGVERVGVRGPERRGGRGLPGQARDAPHQAGRRAAGCTRTRARRCAPTRPATAWRSRRSRSPTRAPPTSRRSPPRSTTTRRPSSSSSRTSSARSRSSASWPRPARAPARWSCCAADPLPLGILKPPGEQGVDICVGEGQTLGNRLDFGGPSFGFFAAAERFMRKMPGRIAGETRDVDGRRGFVLTLQTREQHIRREKATHNICTAQALNALAGVVYLSWLGKRGLVELAELMLRRTHYAREALGLEPINPGRRGARVRRARAGPRRAVRARPRRAGSTPATGSAATTRSTRTACSWRSPSAARARTSTGWPALGGRARRGWRRERSSTRARARTRSRSSSARAQGRRAFVAPAADVPEVPVADLLPASQLRERPAGAARGLASPRSCATT